MDLTQISNIHFHVNMEVTKKLVSNYSNLIDLKSRLWFLIQLQEQ